MDTSKLLIVVDMQNDFIDGSLGTPEAQAIVPKVCEKIKNWDGEIWYTQDTHYDETYLSTQEGKRLPVKHCIKNTDGWMIHEAVREAGLSKGYEGAEVGYLPIFMKEEFGSQWLALAAIPDYVNRDGLRSVELIGLCTDICVLANAVTIKTFSPEIEISVDASCCAGVTPQSHKNALEAMKMLQIEIKNEEA